MRHVLTLLLLGLLAPSLVCAATVTSTPAGGSWSAGSTWVGGAVPAPTDDVILYGPVTLSGAHACAALTIETPGSLQAPAIVGRRLDVAGDVTNGGAVSGGVVPFTVSWGGALTNAGAWTGAVAEFAGAADGSIAHQPAWPIDGDLRRAAGALGDLNALTPLVIGGNVDMGDAPLVLGADCPLTMEQGRLSGAVDAAGNEIRFLSWSYLDQCALDDAVLVGEVEAGHACRFTTRVVVKDVLQNATSTGGGAVIVTGDLINLGEIRNNTSYSLQLQVTGDVQTEGDIATSVLDLRGAGVTHELSMGPAATIRANVFLPEFQPATLRALTPVRFANDVAVGEMGRLELAPGADATFVDFGKMRQGTLDAGGNEVSLAGSATFNDIGLVAARLAGTAALHGDIVAAGGLEVAGTLTSWQWASLQLEVDGLLHVSGVIEDGANPVHVTALGDVENLGALRPSSLTLAGAGFQRLAVGSGVDASQVVLASHLPGTGHQWYRDGLPLPGAQSPDLVLAGAGPADLGLYHCEAGGESSREILILESLDTTDVPGAGVALLGNRPNPFNPATEIVFSLDRSGPVRLTVHDLAGRRVATLVDGEREAGRHAVDWRPRDLASGTYLYRLETAHGVRTGRASLVR